MEATVLSSQWKKEFARVADKRREDIIEAQARVNQLWRDEAKKDKEEELQKRDEMVVQEIILASANDIEQFNITLDTYDEATVKALMLNREQLEAVQERLRPYLEEAYVLPDGRRVFRTKDGKQVFDEHGKELGADEIDPNEIDKKHPFWDNVKDDVLLRRNLTEERRQLIEHQEKLDTARDYASSGGPVSKADLEDMKEDIQKTAPAAVIAQLPEKERREALAAQKTSGTDISMDDLSEMAEPASVLPSKPSPGLGR